MEPENRRENILSFLRHSGKPLSASRLAEQLGVSRQVIVGDIALLRAHGNNIIATARGYTMTPQPAGRYIGKIACQHTLEQTEAELMAVVELGGVVVDVVVEHKLYGDMTGQLNIASAEDVRVFMRRVQQKQSLLLSELTGGIHLHTIACQDAETFAAINNNLSELGVLYSYNE